jgi:hypothetical protein
LPLYHNLLRIFPSAPILLTPKYISFEKGHSSKIHTQVSAASAAV